ncbi:MAG: hypothetical protein PHR44_05410 [Candidatus Omnitrophica bacterium]|nr:hypothetical protein [Candidatus Omnitrophota bacterium]
MFDFKEMGNMMKVAGAVKEAYDRQERLQQESLQMLKKISVQIDEVLKELQSRK